MCPGFEASENSKHDVKSGGSEEDAILEVQKTNTDNQYYTYYYGYTKCVILVELKSPMQMCKSQLKNV